MPTSPFCRIYAPNGVGALTRQCRIQKFIVECLVYAVTLEHKSYGRDSLFARMNVYRKVWLGRMLDREAWMVHMQMMASAAERHRIFRLHPCLRSATLSRCCWAGKRGNRA